MEIQRIAIVYKSHHAKRRVLFCGGLGHSAWILTMRQDYLTGTKDPLSPMEKEIDQALRPLSFSDFAGQDKILENIRVFVTAAKQRGEALDHVLLHGPRGLGKTTLSTSLPMSWELPWKLHSGPVLDKPSDLAGLLTSTSPMMCCLSTKFTALTRSWKSICTRPWRIIK